MPPKCCRAWRSTLPSGTWALPAPEAQLELLEKMLHVNVLECLGIAMPAGTRLELEHPVYADRHHCLRHGARAAMRRDWGAACRPSVTSRPASFSRSQAK